jgi:hypothetical protein
MYPGHPVFLTATIVVPFVGPTMAGAVSGRSAEATTHLTLAAYATRACGPITFEWNTDVPVTYFQIHYWRKLRGREDRGRKRWEA